MNAGTVAGNERESMDPFMNQETTMKQIQQVVGAEFQPGATVLV